MKPVIAIVGRPNAGKSTLFNRLTRSRDALVDDYPGVTRDRHYGSGKWNDIEFSVVDTGGFTVGDTDIFSAKTRDQVRIAVEEADAVILLFDGSSGVSPFDRDLIDLLRDISPPIYFAVNKIDGERHEDKLYEFYSLGIDPIFSISAEHNYGITELMDTLIADFPDAAAEAPESPAVRVAVVGRPNVGKSSLINRILGEERVIVSDIPGTTRDAIDTTCEINGKPYILIDTAGIRKKARVSVKLEKYAIIKSLASLERCDIALIVLDADAGVTEQDIKIAGYAFEKGCGCIFLLNKWDLVPKDGRTVSNIRNDLKFKAKYLSFAPILTVSAKTGQRVTKIFESVDTVYEQYASRISTGPLNRIIEDAVVRTEPSLHHGRRLKFYYTTQTGTKPPTFVTFVNFPEGVHFSYQRYLINQIRTATGLDKTPVRLLLRKRGNEAAPSRARKPRRTVKGRR